MGLDCKRLLGAIWLGVAAPALAQPGPVVGWGFNGCGQAEPQAGLFRAVAGNDCTSVGIRENGSLFQWGETSFPAPSGTFAAVEGSRLHFIGLRTNGTVAHWGFSETPINMVPSGTFRRISTGLDHAIAIRTDGSLVEWGAPPPGTPSGNDFVSVAAGEGQFSFALRANGTIEAWASPSSAQYGVLNVPPGSYTAVVAGQRFGAALRIDGTIAIWGQAFGDPIYLPGVFSAIAATDYTVIGLRPDGSLAHSQPSSIPSGSFVSIGAGNQHGLAIVPPPQSWAPLVLAFALARRNRSR
ncbi:MAG: hypothetical protein ACKVW3_05455 [Phycisphaerales bacterium]